MDWYNERLSKRLSLNAEKTGAIYAVLSEIDALSSISGWEWAYPVVY